MNFHIAIPSCVPENLSTCLDAIYMNENVTPDDITVVVDECDAGHFTDDRCRYVINNRPRDGAYAHFVAQRQGGVKDIVVCDDDVRLVTKNGFSILAEKSSDHQWGVLLPSFHGDRISAPMGHLGCSEVRSVVCIGFHCTYMRRGQLELADGQLRLTETGLLLADSVTAEFL